jgi:Protein of unknown function (DUF2975)
MGFGKRQEVYMENAQRITVLSRRLKLVCIGLIGCLPVLCAIFWVLFNRIYAIMPMISLPVRLHHALTPFTRLLGFLSDLVPLAALIYGLLKLKTLFLLYENGNIFTEANVKCYRSLGRTLMAWVACDIVSRALLGIVLTLDRGPGNRLLILGLDGGDFTGIFVGIVILIIAWVMDEARKIREDQALII